MGLSNGFCTDDLVAESSFRLRPAFGLVERVVARIVAVVVAIRRRAVAVSCVEDRTPLPNSVIWRRNDWHAKPLVGDDDLLRPGRRAQSP